MNKIIKKLQEVYEAMMMDNEHQEALDKAIDALGKQIPINVKESKKHPFGECPRCLADFNSELQSEYEIEYCPYCGQRLDWAESIENKIQSETKAELRLIRENDPNK